jgi:hypothetical protein
MSEKKHKTKAKTKGIVSLCLSLTQSRSLSIGQQKAAKPEGERRISKIGTKINQTSFCFLFVSSALPKSHVVVIPPSIPLAFPHILLLVDFERLNFDWVWQQRHLKMNYCS